MNQEIIELLKDIRHGIDYEFHGKCRCELLVKCNQALTKLRTEQPYYADMERRLKAHSAGEAVKHFCRECRKPFWNVDDEPIVCPHCGSKEMPVPDIDAEQIA